MAVVTILHPGAMGVSVGTSVGAGGHEVRWVTAGRSAETAARASAGGLVGVDGLGAALDGCDAVVSVCPPAAAGAVATEVAAAIGEGAACPGVFVDANAVSPATVRAVGEVLAGRSIPFVDGAIVGPPAHRPGTTRLFLSGGGAAEVAAVFGAGHLDVVVVDGPVGQASALKVAYAAWTKGTSALLLAVAAYAEAEGVDEVLVSEWARSQPDLSSRLARSAAGSAPKAWRFDGELVESARAFADVGLPDGFSTAAAEVYRGLARFKDRPGDVTPAEVTAALLEARPGAPPVSGGQA